MITLWFRSLLVKFPTFFVTTSLTAVTLGSLPLTTVLLYSLYQNLPDEPALTECSLLYSTLVRSLFWPLRIFLCPLSKKPLTLWNYTQLLFVLWARLKQHNVHYRYLLYFLFFSLGIPRVWLFFYLSLTGIPLIFLLRYALVLKFLSFCPISDLIVNKWQKLKFCTTRIFVLESLTQGNKLS